jgi:Spy/CpxP family protein refolding chaperone
MTEQASSAALHNAPENRARYRRRGPFFILAVALAAGLTGAAATRAVSQGAFGGGAPWHHGGFIGSPIDPARIEDRADRMVRHLAIEIDATSEQQEKLRSIVKAAVRDLVPMGEKARAARLQGRQLFTQPTINRAEIEKLRAEQIALVDAASRRFTQALADAAEVLTPEQRQKLNERLPPPGYWRWWHRG